MKKLLAISMCALSLSACNRAFRDRSNDYINITIQEPEPKQQELMSNVEQLGIELNPQYQIPKIANDGPVPAPFEPPYFAEPL